MEKHILIVDDSPTIRSSVVSCLSEANYKITEAENGVDALEKLLSMKGTAHNLALIITDINMPKMDGINLIKNLKKGEFRFLPILVLTTESETSMIEKGKQAGAAGWLVKPFKPDQLLWAVKKLVWT